MNKIFTLALLFFLLFCSSAAQQEHKIVQNHLRESLKALKSRKVYPNLKAINLTPGDSAQEWVRFRNWNEANVVVAENDSIVWVGTTVGLLRWNVLAGTCQTFDESNGLDCSSVTSLAFDSKRQLWIGTSQGLVKYSRGIFTFYNHLNSPIPDVGITNLVIDGADRIYACTDAYFDSYSWTNGGFIVYDGSSWKTVIIPIDGWIGPIWSIGCYHDTIYVCCGFTQLYIYTTNGLELAPTWSFGGATSFAVDYQDSLWAQSNGMKTLKYSGNQWKVVIDNEKNNLGNLWSEIWNDPRGGLWFSKKDYWFDPSQVLYRLDIDKQRRGVSCSSWLPPGICPVPGLTQQFNSHSALNSNNQFFATRWGLIKFDGSSWQSILAPKSLLSNVIYSLGAAPSGEVYLSSEMAIQKTDGMKWDSLGGLGWIDPEIKFRPNGTFWQNGINGRYATGLDFDGYDALWAAYVSVMTANPRTGFREWLPNDIGMERPPEYSSPQFMDVAIDKEENIWATGWYDGTVMYDRTNWHPYYTSDTTLPNGNYDRVFTDSRNRIWFGTNQWSPNYGFSVLEKGKWKTYYSPQRYSISYVYQFAEDHFGNVWLATGGGLLKYDGVSFTIYDNTNSRLRTNLVYSVTVDLANNIWVGTTSGLYVLNASHVRLGPFTYSSPTDSFSVTPAGTFATARFTPHSISEGEAKYELQRGRSKSKFWTITATDFLSTCCSPLELRDTTAIIGSYYYRIKRIESSGNTSYSPAQSFTGLTKQARLLDSKWYLSENHVVLKWKLGDEAFVAGFEIVRKDPTSSESKVTASVSINTFKNTEGYYVTEADSLRHTSGKFLYTIRAVFADSTRLDLQTFAIDPLFPASFGVSNNFPNPFNSSTTLQVYLPVPDKVVIRIFDMLGREILPSITEEFTAGYHQVQFDFRTVASGVYIYNVEASGKNVAGKMLLIK